jgi:dephospho-CoA kinase
MIKVGITGGIGSGKTIICAAFEKLCIPVYYADPRAKALMNNDPAIRQGLIDKFGPLVYNNDGLCRDKLASIIFTNKDAIEYVNSLVHPAVAADFIKWSNLHTDKPYVMEEAALLFESGAAQHLDCVITVSAPLDIRLNRVMLRDNASPEQIQKRMDNQWPEEEKIRQSQFVIFNNEKESLLKQINNIHLELQMLSARKK